MGIIYINLCGNLQVYTIFFKQIEDFQCFGTNFLALLIEQ